MATQHNHAPRFGMKFDGCPRCDELKAGAAPVSWNLTRKLSDAQRVADIRAHDCKASHCGPVCTFDDY